MKKVQRIAAVGVATLGLAGAGLVTASGAMAASNCTNIGNGNLCINYDPQGYQASYYRSGGTGSPYLDFNLVCDSGAVFGDNGAFPAAAGSTHSYVFQVGSQGRCHITMYDRTHGGSFNSPSISR